MPLHDAVRNDLSDIFRLGQLIEARGQDGIEVRETASERLGHARADVQDAQSVKHAPHVARFAGYDAVEKIARGLFTHAFEIGEFSELEPIKVRHVANEAALHELCDQHLAAAFDVHGAAGAPVLDATADLRRAIRIRATPDGGFAFGCRALGDLRAALGAFLRETKVFFAASSLARHHAYDF